MLLITFAMKKLELIIPDNAFGIVDKILNQSKVGGVNHYRIDGRGRNTSIFIPKTKVEVVIKDEQVETLISIIVEKLSAIRVYGKIFVCDIPIAVDIVTKEKGESII